MKKFDHGLHIKVELKLFKAIKAASKRRKENMSFLIREALTDAFLKEKKSEQAESISEILELLKTRDM